MGSAAVWALDLDGVMWLGETPIPGAAEATARLSAAGHTVVFCTNNSSQRVSFYQEKLARFGVAAQIATNVISSAQAAGSMLSPCERVLLCAGDGAREAAELAGAEIVFNPSATVAGLSEYLWRIEQPAHAVANQYHLTRTRQVKSARAATLKSRSTISMRTAWDDTAREVGAKSASEKPISHGRTRTSTR